jgi:two-component system, OmpR family, phosphate regulon sensor histidine kinase PhoR
MERLTKFVFYPPFQDVKHGLNTTSPTAIRLLLSPGNMNAQRIRLIIGMMTLALVGVICLQIYWIGWNIRLNENQFDKLVLGAMNKVADRLEYYENAAVVEALNKTRSAGKIREAARYLESGDAYRRVDTAVIKEVKPVDTVRDKSNVDMWEYMKVSQLVDTKPLSERIPLDLLGQWIQEEFDNVGINAARQFGVYSKERNSFVIVNGYFVVEDSSPQVTHGNAATLYNSQYRVAMFQRDAESPGYLSLYFPNRTRLVWGSVIWPLILSVLFSGIILYCFWYTIRVIYRQKQLSEMKTDFINNMTHEFKTPIATISLATDSILSPIILGTPDKIRRFVDIIKQENRRMNSQVERVLQMALIDKKDFHLNLDELNVHDIIHQAVSNFSLQVEKREGTLTAQLNAQRPIIEGDATHIASVIHNLLDNANKYSPDKPLITISTRDVSMGVEITVTDNGMGISKEARKNIFDKFYRVSTGNIHDVKGFGLGLSYVKAIVTAHKGLIDVKSEPGKGSSFMLTFPTRVSEQPMKAVYFPVKEEE